LKALKVLAIVAALAVGAVGISFMTPLAEAGIKMN
jgi:hypothetical protein